MTDFKNVYIGDDELLKQSTLGDLANNDQYLYEQISNCAWGLQAWKNVTSNVAVANSKLYNSQQVLMSFNATFYEGRQYRINFSAKSHTTTGAGFDRLVIACYINGTSLGGCISDVLISGITYGVDSMEWIFVPSDYGAQTVYIYSYWTSGNLSTTINAAATSPMQAWVDDIGPEIGSI